MNEGIQAGVSLNLFQAVLCEFESAHLAAGESLMQRGDARVELECVRHFIQ
jgi:hypothetical protein